MPEFRRLDSLIICLFVFLWNLPIETSADDAKVRLTVRRDNNLLMSRSTNVYVYVNGDHVGTLINGEKATFAFPISSDGIYNIKFDNWTGMASSNTLVVHAKPDEHIACSVGTEQGWWLQGMRGRNPYVEPIFPTRVFFITDRPVDVAIDGQQYSITESRYVDLPQRTTASGIVRLTYGAMTSRKTYPLFTSPNHTPVVDVSSKSTAENRMIASEEFLHQMELARNFHFRSSQPNVFDRAQAFCQDTLELRNFGVGSKVLDLRDAELVWIGEIEPLVTQTVSADLAAAAISSVFACTVESIAARRPPTEWQLAWESCQILFDTTYKASSRRKTIEDKTTNLAAKRKEVFDALLISDDRVAGRHMNPAVQDWRLQKSILGKWSYTFPIDDTTRTYSFREGGVIEEAVDGELNGFGSYIVWDGKLIVRWPSGAEEIARCEDFTGGSVLYKIIAHSDSAQAGITMRLRRE